MDEYIKREAALRIVKNYGKGAIDGGRKTLDPVDDIIALATGIELIPAADVVEVVRCKDCKWSEDLLMSGIYCNHPDNRNPLSCRPNDYCNDGERKRKNCE